MKKIIFSLFTFVILLSNTLSLQAASSSSYRVEVVPLGNGYQVVISTEISNTLINSLAGSGNAAATPATPPAALPPR